MNFYKLAISEDRLSRPISDRHLPSHPKEIYGLLPYWYFRTRFPDYGLPDYDLPMSWVRRQPEYNEPIWFKESKVRGMPIYTHIFPLGMLLPFHDLFFEAHPPLEVIGEKRDPNEPIGFRYL